MPSPTFADALADAQCYGGPLHLLLGNGFSIACRPDIFRYGKLYEQANFTKLSPYVKKAFQALNTQDFERVIKAVRDTSSLLKAYGVAPAATIQQIEDDANGLRELLVETIADSHPAWPGEVTDDE